MEKNLIDFFRLIIKTNLIFYNAIIFLYSIYLSHVSYISTNFSFTKAIGAKLAEKKSFSLVNKSREFPTSLMMYLNYPFNFQIHEIVFKRKKKLWKVLYS